MARTDVIEWLLEPKDIGVRYLALRDLTRTTKTELLRVREQAHSDGPIAKVLARMNADGFWSKPGAGYSPKYRGTVWTLMLLAQLGARVELDERIAHGCAYLVDHAYSDSGQFGYNGTAAGTVDCLQGNLCAALVDLGYQDARLDKAFEWMARSVTGQGVASQGDKATAVRYYAHKCGPGFACGANNKLPCAWGAVKVMSAFARLPRNKRTPLIESAIQAGVDFLLGRDPAMADYPTRTGSKPSSDWWKFGFPVFYVADLLQNVEVLAGLGLGQDARLQHALDLIRAKRDAEGRWPLEYEYADKTWIRAGTKREANKWVTLRALRVLKAAGASD